MLGVSCQTSFARASPRYPVSGRWPHTASALLRRLSIALEEAKSGTSDVDARDHVTTKSSRLNSNQTQPVLCQLDAISDGGAIAVDTSSEGETLNLIVLRRGDEVFAYHNVCSHAGRRLDYAPGQFLVRGDRVICAAHGAVFDVCSGICREGPGGGGLSSVAVTVRDGNVHLVE